MKTKLAMTSFFLLTLVIGGGSCLAADVLLKLTVEPADVFYDLDGGGQTGRLAVGTTKELRLSVRAKPHRLILGRYGYEDARFELKTNEGATTIELNHRMVPKELLRRPASRPVWRLLLDGREPIRGSSNPIVKLVFFGEFWDDNCQNAIGYIDKLLLEFPD